MEIIGYIFAFGLFILANPLLGFFVYILPAFLALILRKRNVFPIIILNILFAWFLPLWIVLLIWSILGESKEDRGSLMVNLEMKDRLCRYCPRIFPRELDTCPHCGKKQLPVDL